MQQLGLRDPCTVVRVQPPRLLHSQLTCGLRVDVGVSLPAAVKSPQVLEVGVWGVSGWYWQAPLG
jgi:hypothetical protein